MKTVAFIDTANIILSSRRGGVEIDFLKLKAYLFDKFKVDEIYYFTANLKFLNEDLKTLQENGFNIILKDVYYENSQTKANCDVEIAHYITKMIENKNLLKLILLSGDGDFSILLDYAHDCGIGTVLMPTDVKTSSKILRIKKYLKIIFLDQIINKIGKEKTPTNT
jgi:uncharacterized LabA/DUF88 family protein